VSFPPDSVGIGHWGPGPCGISRLGSNHTPKVPVSCDITGGLWARFFPAAVWRRGNSTHPGCLLRWGPSILPEVQRPGSLPVWWPLWLDEIRRAFGRHVVVYVSSAFLALGGLPVACRLAAGRLRRVLVRATYELWPSIRCLASLTVTTYQN